VDAVKNLKESETQIAQMAISMENLQLAVADFKTPQTAVKENPVTELITDFEPEFYT
jgi:hypothetical protein